MPTETAASKWLTSKFLQWQLEAKRKKTVTEFAHYFGVSRDVLNQWMNGRRSPGRESVRLIAAKLGPEIYDTLGLARPSGDSPGERLNRLWGKANESIQQQFLQLLDTLEQEESQVLGSHQASPTKPR